MSGETAQNSSKMCRMTRGIRFPRKEQLHPKKNFEDALDLKPREGDLVLLCFPKTGSTWAQYILLQIQSRGRFFPSFNELKFKIWPSIGIAGVAAVEAQGDGRRFYKLHIPYDKIRKNPKSKYIYTYRHPEDTFVSLYHYVNKILLKMDFDEMFECFVSGDVPYDSYFEHVLSAYRHREDGNILMVSYEKLHSNRRREILRIAKFLGQEHYDSLKEDGELLDKILEHTDFHYMKRHLTESSPDPSKYLAVNCDFFRKGVVGGGKAALTEVQRRRLREAAEKVLKGTSILEEWYSSEKKY